MSDTLARLRADLEKTERALAPYRAQDASESALGAHFPLGTGNPGNASSRRTSTQAARRVDASIDGAVRRSRLVREAERLRAAIARLERRHSDQSQPQREETRS